MSTAENDAIHPDCTSPSAHGAAADFCRCRTLHAKDAGGSAGAPIRCESGHPMRANPTPGPGRPEFVHYWPQDLAECPIPSAVIEADA